MTRTPHDALGKALLKSWLAPVGRVESSHELNPSPRWADIAFWPRTPLSLAPHLGLLGRMACGPAIFEIFRDPIDHDETEEAIGKLLEARAEQRRQQKDKLEPAPQPPRLWLLTPTAPSALLEDFGARSSGDWMAGFYFLAPALGSVVVVLHQLPILPETLWLRLLGRGGTQKRALDEVQRLPSSHPLREATLHRKDLSRS